MVKFEMWFLGVSKFPLLLLLAGIILGDRTEEGTPKRTRRRRRRQSSTESEADEVPAKRKQSSKGLTSDDLLKIITTLQESSIAGMDVLVDLRGPRFVVHRNSAILRCEHNVDPETLYKVAFYKYGQRIMKFVRGRDPPFELFNMTGAEINLIQLSPTSITLERLDFSASGSYACEIALETPLYSKISKPHELTVIVRQKHRPKIKIKHKKLSPSDYLEATCQSAAAHPAPHLTWFINHVKVDERLTIPHGTVNIHRHHHGMQLSVTNSSLHFPLTTLQLFPNQTVDITCLSTIPSYAGVSEGFADVQNHTITVNVVRIEPTPTQLPVKIVSPELNLSSRSKIQDLAIIVFTLVCHFTY